MTAPAIDGGAFVEGAPDSRENRRLSAIARELAERDDWRYGLNGYYLGESQINKVTDLVLKLRGARRSGPQAGAQAPPAPASPPLPGPKPARPPAPEPRRPQAPQRREPDDVHRTAAGPGLAPEPAHPQARADEGACPRCDRDACEGCGVAPWAGPTGEPAPRVLRFEWAGDLLARLNAQPPPAWFAQDLVPDEGIVAWHGRPRSMKSLAAQDVALALATGTPALGSERFGVPSPVGVLWLTEEDSERLWAFRLRLMLAGRKLDCAPKLLRVCCRPGWNLERPEDQAATLDAIREAPEARVLIIDPARGSLPSIDKGPGDAAPAVRFLRQIQRETTIRTIAAPHHDVKPDAVRPDSRSRAEKASGGVIFSIAECPVNFERRTDREADAFPTAYKLSADPARFRVTFLSETPPGEAFRGFIRAEAVTVTDSDDSEADRAKVLAFVREHAWSSTREVEHGAKLRTGEATRILAQLEAVGLVVRAAGDEAKARGRSSNAVLWGPA